MYDSASVYPGVSDGARTAQQPGGSSARPVPAAVVEVSAGEGGRRYRDRGRRHDRPSHATDREARPGKVRSRPGRLPAPTLVRPKANEPRLLSARFDRDGRRGRARLSSPASPGAAGLGWDTNWRHQRPARQGRSPRVTVDCGTAPAVMAFARQHRLRGLSRRWRRRWRRPVAGDAQSADEARRCVDPGRAPQAGHPACGGA